MGNSFFCKATLGTCLLALVLMAAVGCPVRPQNDGTAKLTVVFTAAQSLKAGPSPLGLDDLESLIVTVTEVVLDRSGDDENGDDLEDPVDEDKSGGQVSVFSGAVEVDLLDLAEVSEVLSSVDVPAGSYTKIRLSIENPRLVTAADPETVHTDVHLTANGRVFINEDFELEEGEQNLLVLDVGGIHIAALGNGGFVLTPQLRAALQITSAVTTASGVIDSVDEANGVFVLALTEGTVEVVYTQALIYLPDDTDTPTGTEADLQPGVEVEVYGRLFIDGSIAAATIHIIEDEEEEEEEEI